MGFGNPARLKALEAFLKDQQEGLDHGIVEFERVFGLLS
jgi:hypothetical protein